MLLATKKKLLPWLLAAVGFLFMVFFLREVFAGHWILKQSFHVGVVDIHYYGLIMAAAVLAAFWFGTLRAKSFGINEKQGEDLLVWLVIGGFICARLYHVGSDWDFYWHNPLLIFQVWRGGLSIYGALFGGVLALWLYKKSVQLPFSLYHLLDWLAPCLLLGQIIGRFGNLFNYEVFGYPTSLPWKMFVPLEFRPLGFAQFVYFQPFFLYEVVGNLLILFLLLKVIKFRRQGSLFFSYLLLYNALRFFLEFVRTDSTFIGNFRLNALVSLALAALAGGFLIYRKFAHEQQTS